MAYTTIDDPSAYFKVQLYTGTGSSQAVTFDDTDTDMSPNLVIIKVRDAVHPAEIYDTVRGVTKRMYVGDTDAETTNAEGLTAFGSDGFTVGTQDHVNEDTKLVVSWNWNESATSGMDIVGYTGTGSARTISHSLSAVPHFMVVFNRDSAMAHSVYHHKIASDPETDRIMLDESSASEDDSGIWNDEAPTSSVFSLGTSSSTNTNTDDYVIYLFSEKQGFSKFSSFTGTESATTAPFIYTGFRPSTIIFKPDASANWTIVDTTRNTVNPVADKTINLDLSAGNEHDGSADLDILSNGFKIRNANTDTNYSGNIIYAAWAEAPFVNSNGVPCNAR